MTFKIPLKQKLFCLKYMFQKIYYSDFIKYLVRLMTFKFPLKQKLF